ncbi:MAG: ARMT1-like domain-containing protein [bacterium]
MKTSPDCIPCLFRQALHTARIASKDPAVHRRILLKLARMIPERSMSMSPAAYSQPVYTVVSSVSGVRDPFAKQKKETNRIALGLLAHFRRLVARADDPLNAALHAAVGGNIIDLGINQKFDIGKDIRKIMHRPFAVTAIKDFRKDIGPGRRLLYLGDNAGEIVFDVLLVEQILKTGTDVTFTVKSGPVINDATMEDAKVSGMTALVKVIETGSDDIGVNLARASRQFKQAFRTADVILGKGHGNFETCHSLPGNIYSLLKAKCNVVADALGVEPGDIAFHHARRGPGKDLRHQTTPRLCSPL